MAINFPQIKQSDLTHYIQPKGKYETFRDEEHYLEKTREWELNSKRTSKREFWYLDKDKFYGLAENTRNFSHEMNRLRTRCVF